jgi:hypothetical protein
MQRVFTLVENLESAAGHRADDSASKADELVGSATQAKDSQLALLTNTMFLKLPPAQGEQMVAALRGFMMNRTLPSVASEASTMFRWVGGEGGRAGSCRVQRRC